MSDIALLHATFADRAEAKRIAETVLAERLAACVNILAPCRSLYRWQGQIERSDEVPALFKTTPMLARRLHDRIAELHSYDLPVIETWPVAVDKQVAAWIAAETG
ncbi:divalent-cation tolerance protein CutA [Sphingomonas sp. dw_22]|uniref:divalent-cation tolerance protein CutA n=1 Tax=Sphingomonas sp. dw_22 TaxID=2721175 RepID=UPI001BD59AAA|nr:divalent-cation tolerance protein CutA [Sphingomonas sp. dw_22]